MSKGQIVFIIHAMERKVMARQRHAKTNVLYVVDDLRDLVLALIVPNSDFSTMCPVTR